MQTTATELEARYFRNALGQFTTGITIITTCTPEGKPIGFTANSFNSVSLSPPMVLWSLSVGAGCLPVFRNHTHYGINVLAADQLELSRRFATRAIDEALAGGMSRFDDLQYRIGTNGVPILGGCCAWFECYNRSQYEEGDHVIFVGEVEHCGFEPREPLAFQAGRYQVLQAHPDIAQHA